MTTSLETPPQQVRIGCTPEEFEAVRKGDKAFEIKITDPRAPVIQGDLIAVELINPDTGKPSGDRIIKKVTYVTHTKHVEGLASREAIDNGLTILSFAEPEVGSLTAVYSENYTMSIGIDRFNPIPQTDEDSFGDPRILEIIEGPAYTPALMCPDFMDAGVLDGINIDRWPPGRYSITLMLNIDIDEEKGPPFRIDIIDAIILVFVKHPTNPRDMKLEPVAIEGLISHGRLVSELDGRPVQALDLDDVAERLMTPMTRDGLDAAGENSNGIITEDELIQIMEEARARGEDVSEMEAVLSGEDPIEDHFDHNFPYDLDES